MTRWFRVCIGMAATGGLLRAVGILARAGHSEWAFAVFVAACGVLMWAVWAVGEKPKPAAKKEVEYY